MAATKVKLSICGGQYIISSNESEEYLTKLSKKLDEDMNKLMSQATSASVTTAAVMTALSYLDEFEKSQSGVDNMRAQIKDYLEDAAHSKIELEDVKRELVRTKKELATYKIGMN